MLQELAGKTINYTTLLRQRLAIKLKGKSKEEITAFALE